jgi:TRAP transporter 4TM/12TM fusion protein
MKSDTNQASSIRGKVYIVLSVVLCVFVLVAVNTNLFDAQPNLAVFGMLGLILVFLNTPACKWCPENRILKAVDIVLIIATIVSFGYVFIQSERLTEAFWVDGTVLGNRAGNETTMDFVIAAIGLLLVLEATRRAIGWTLPILCVVFILYALNGQSMPDWLFPHRGASWQQVAQSSFLQAGGVFGIALRVMFYYVFLFVLFGTLLEQTGATSYVINFARRLFERIPGGPALVSVVSSAMMGSLSGSAVANTATTGTMTIPLMKSSGFSSESAAGVEAAASSGGALMPPIMGAGAFMMLEMVEPAVTYPQIIKAAIIPALLYYSALLLTVYFYARRIDAGAEAGATDGKPKRTGSLFQGIVFFGSFLVLIVMLVPPISFTPFRAVSFGLVAILVLSVFSKHTWIGSQTLKDLDTNAFAKVIARYFAGVVEAMVKATRGGVALVVASCCVGVILAIVDLTGIGATLPAKVLALSGESPILALLLLMVSTIILGMGLPSAVCYLLMAILVGTVLTQLDTAPLAAHLFIFYFGMMSMVTPPVALAAYAGAAIAKADVMKSAFAAFRFALVGFALPFAFVLSPELILLTPDNQPASIVTVVSSVGLTLAAILGLAAGIAGFAFTRLGGMMRAVLVCTSLVVFFCRLQGVELAIQAMAVVAIGVILALNYSSRRSNVVADN